MGDREKDSSNEQEQPEPVKPEDHPTRDDDTLLDDFREGDESGDLRKS
jgi:hypothetical protein